MGAESSGKTTLSEALARVYETIWVPEYGRFFWEAKRHLSAGVWSEEDFVHIATIQNLLEDQYAERAQKFLICDTTALCTSVWHQRYLNSRSSRVDGLAQGRSYDLIFFCEPDFPFVQDGTRDGESIREEMAEWIRQRLVDSGVSFVSLRGSHADRLVQARFEIDRKYNREARV